MNEEMSENNLEMVPKKDDPLEELDLVRLNNSRDGLRQQQKNIIDNYNSLKTDLNSEEAQEVLEPISKQLEEINQQIEELEKRRVNMAA
jgi:polyhydroxyalkanoate synthesis regulator phasin